jgi:hypothetical protein
VPQRRVQGLQPIARLARLANAMARNFDDLKDLKQEAVGMYLKILAKIQKKVGGR